MTRTDLHRPSVIVPEDYRFVACDYYGSGLDALGYVGDRMAFRADMERTGGRFSGHEHGGTCHVCGASALYVAKYHHKPTNSYIVTGLDCAEKMDIADEVAFRSFKKRIAAGRKMFRGLAKAQETLNTVGLQAAWAIYSATDRTGHAKAEEIVFDIVGKLVKYGSISDPQTALISRLLGDIAARPARQAAFQAARAVEAANSRHVGTVGERRDFTLTATFRASFDTQYGTLFVHGFKDPEGNVVIYKGGKAIAERGETIRVKATVKDHGVREGVQQTIIARPAVLAGAGAEAQKIAA